MRMPAAVQTAVNAFNASTGGVKTIGLAPKAFLHGEITFAGKSEVLHSLKPVIQLEKDYGCDCYCVKGIDSNTELARGMRRIGGIFERRLAEFLPENDIRGMGDKGMRDRVWGDTRELTLKDLFTSIRTVRTIDWAFPGGTINSSGYQFIAESILKHALTDSRGLTIGDPSLRQVAAYIEKMKGKKGTDRAADHMIASAVLYSMVSSSVEEALRNSSLMSGAAELYGALRLPYESAIFYELALDMMPPWRSMDEDERKFKNELHSAAARQWLVTLSPGSRGDGYYLSRLFRAMRQAWEGADMEMLGDAHSLHASFLNRNSEYQDAAHAKFRQGLTEVESFERSNWDLGGDDVNRAAVERIVSIFDAGAALLAEAS